MSVPAQLLNEVPVRFPVELSLPRGFRPDRMSTWPHVAGSMEVVVGTNEAGMLLGKSVRGADAAIWRRDESHLKGTLRRTPPVLAVEVAGDDDEVEALRRKARWYLKHGVEMVWLVFPKTRSVSVVTGSRTRSFKNGDRLPAPRTLKGLEPRVRELLFQLR